MAQLHSLLLLLLLALSGVSVVQARTDAEARLQCVARCLQEFKSKVDEKTKTLLKLRPQLVASQCAQRPLPGEPGDPVRENCQTCFKTCSNYGVEQLSHLKNCRQFCTTSQLDQTQCEPVCANLRILLRTNPGRCPARVSRKDCQLARRSCEPGDDRHCFGEREQRCCNTVCGGVCLNVNVTMDALPEISAAPRLIQTKKLKPGRRRGSSKSSKSRSKSGGGVVEAQWTGYNLLGSVDPVVFLVQVRSHRGLEFNPGEMSANPWNDLAYTSQLSLQITALKVGYWYQFRLAAISARGLRGYSVSSAPIKLEREPRRPGPPRDLREGRSRIHDGLVDVQLLWKKPKRSDLPLDKYEIKWKEHYGYIGGSDKDSLTDYRTAVPPTNTQYYLIDLKPGTSYKVKVYAVAHYGSAQLRSRKASIFINTLSIPTNKPEIKYSQGLLQDLEAAFSDCTCGGRRPGPVLTKKPYYEKQNLKMKVVWNHPTEEQPWMPVYPSKKVDHSVWVSTYILEWGQKVCIDSGNAQVTPGDRTPRRVTVNNDLQYTISGLRFNCHYVIGVQGLSDAGKPVVQWRTCFCTPPCKETPFAKTEKPPNCPREVNVHMPRSPLRVRASVTKGASSSSMVLARISWAAPSIMYAINGFRVSWGPRVQEQVPITSYGRGGLLPRLDPSAATTKVLESSRRSLMLRDLKMDEVYVVQVQTITVFGDSPVREIFFLTPRSRDNESRAPSTQTVRAYVRPNSSAQQARLSLSAALLLLLSWLRAL